MSLTVLIDDVRWFRDARPCEVARTSSAGVALLLSLKNRHIDELWLDHDLGGEDTIMPVIDLLCEQRFAVTKTWIQSVNPAGAVIMRQRLFAVGYEVSHHFDVRIFQNSRPKVSDPHVTLGARGGRP